MPHPTVVRSIPAVALLIASAACGPVAALSDASAADGDAAGFSRDVAPILDASPPDQCPDTARGVRVTSIDGRLFEFDPPSLRFSELPRPRCAGEMGSVYSMTVDRAGDTWVSYGSGHLFRVDGASGVCTALPFAGTSIGFTRSFSLGFSRDPHDQRRDRLYLSAMDTGLIAALDPETFTATTIGPLVADPPQAILAELSGTRDGRLFAYIGSMNPTQLATVDPTSGRAVDLVSIPGLDTNGSFAFAFWSGDFFIFTGLPDGVSSRVTRYRPADGTFNEIVASTGFRITGAGVSTCAPPG